MSHFSLLVVTRGQAHVNGGVDGTVQVRRLDVHLMQFPIFGTGEGDNGVDRGEARDGRERILEVNTVYLS